MAGSLSNAYPMMQIRRTLCRTNPRLHKTTGHTCRSTSALEAVGSRSGIVTVTKLFVDASAVQAVPGSTRDKPTFLTQ